MKQQLSSADITIYLGGDIEHPWEEPPAGRCSRLGRTDRLRHRRARDLTLGLLSRQPENPHDRRLLGSGDAVDAPGGWQLGTDQICESYHRRMERWRQGDGVLLRHVHGGFVRYAIPTTVVEDSQQRVALYLAEGTPLRWTTRLAAIKEPVAAPEERRWQSTNVLTITERDAAHSVWVMWHASTDAFLGWYVNLQRPLVRTSLGFDTWDQSLDIVVDDQLRWRWKDEEDFAEVQRLGILDASEASLVRAEGEAVILRIEARRPPFSSEWPSWTPDPSWPVPAIPQNWAEVPPVPP